MTFNVSIEGTTHQFPVEDGESVLQAALKAGIVIPYACRDGACGSCKGKVIAGQVDYGKYAAKALEESESALAWQNSA